MNARFEHWHPVARSRSLRARAGGPLRVTLSGHTLAVFRTGRGVIGAVDDTCLHRRASLSNGRVDGETLACPYHGWRYAVDGTVTCPGDPRRRLSATVWEACERYGLVWVRRAGASTAFPRLDTTGFEAIGVFRHRVAAPFEVVLDNFVEVEHTGNVHWLLGYDPAALDRVTVDITTTDRTVRVVNRGPQQPLPALVERAFRIRSGDTFVDDWTTRFSPVHSVYDHYWVAPDGVERPDRLRTAVFFNPVDEDTTELWSLAFVRYTGSRWLGRLLRPLSAALVEVEVRRDRRMIEGLADKRADLEGMKLGRFDKALGPNRRRIRSLYDGR